MENEIKQAIGYTILSCLGSLNTMIIYIMIQFHIDILWGGSILGIYNSVLAFFIFVVKFKYGITKEVRQIIKEAVKSPQTN